METIDLGVKFVRGFIPAPTPVPGPDFPGGAQTGDINILLIVGFLLLAISIAGIVLYAVMQKKEIVTAAHVQNKIFQYINATIASKVSAVCLLLISAVLIVFGCLIGNAHADEAYKQINPDKTNIQAVVNEDGLCTFENCTLDNSSWDNYILASIKVDLTDEAKNIEGLRDTTLQMLNNDNYIYNDHPNGQYSIPKELTYLSAYSQLQLSFGVKDIDALTFESMFDKQIFTISLSFNKLYDVVYFGNNQTSGFAPWPEHKVFNSPLMIPDNYGNLEKDGYYFYGWNTEPDGSGIHFDPYDMYFINAPLFLYAEWESAVPPLYDCLYQYSLNELQRASDYLVEHYSDGPDDPVVNKFMSFLANGVLSDGSDNGVCMSENPNKNNHWAIDEDGKLYGQEGFKDKSDTTIQVRLIGILHDEDANGNKIGLTFMTTHAVGECLYYDDADFNDPIYGWSGLGDDTTNQSCILRAKLNDGTLFPTSLLNAVKEAKTDYMYSGQSDHGTVLDKFWAPSGFELYSDPSQSLAFKGWWPIVNEGNWYEAFIDKVDVSSEKFSIYSNIDYFQSGDYRSEEVWTRTLREGSAHYALCIDGEKGRPSGNSVSWSELGVIACFCI